MLQQLIDWIDAHWPTWCPYCRYLMFRKNAKRLYRTSGATELVCKDCYKRIYHPYTGE